MTVSVEYLINKSTDIYSLPQIYYEIDQAIEDPTASYNKISSIISRDTGLSARLLRLVNSAFFSLPKPVDTISRAVQVVGTKQLRDLVLATSVIKLFKDLDSRVVDMESFWRHSIACGVAARILATQRREANVESHFVAGLLHDVGYLILYRYLSKELAQLQSESRDKKTPLLELEKPALGYTHATVGGYLMKAWRLPANLIDTVFYHHAPQKSKVHKVESAIANASEFVSTALEMGASGEYYSPPLQEEAWKSLQLPHTTLSAMVPVLENQAADAVRCLLNEN